MLIRLFQPATGYGGLRLPSNFGMSFPPGKIRDTSLFIVGMIS